MRTSENDISYLIATWHKWFSDQTSRSLTFAEEPLCPCDELLYVKRECVSVTHMHICSILTNMAVSTQKLVPVCLRKHTGAAHTWARACTHSSAPTHPYKQESLGWDPAQTEEGRNDCPMAEAKDMGGQYLRRPAGRARCEGCGPDPSLGPARQLRKAWSSADPCRQARAPWQAWAPSFNEDIGQTAHEWQNQEGKPVSFL